ncbi:MAG: glutamine-hydrolyzing GMP synthase [Candidatus Aminicenantia bacterium]
MDKILILDFGSQYTQLIARRVRELGVYSEIKPYFFPIHSIKDFSPRGIILSGGPRSVLEENAPTVETDLFKLGIPILGICYGLQLISHLFNGKVRRAEKREYGKAVLKIHYDKGLLKGIKSDAVVWMSHGDEVYELPPGFILTASTTTNEVAVIENHEDRLFGVQFHPEVSHTEIGRDILSNFIFDVAGASKSWNLSAFIDKSVREIKEKVGDKKVLCALSGGVDSTVTALLVNKAIGKNLTCVFVNTGLLRLREHEEMMEKFRRLTLHVFAVDASTKFLKALKGVKDPERKRKIIGSTFIRVFEGKAKELGEFEFFAQGTTYPDVIESVSQKGPSSKIKSHHNVGGLPKRMKFKLLEPLRELFKDEVREIGMKLGLDEDFVWQHPFPGPGLAVRIVGEITEERLLILRQADRILLEEVRSAGIYRNLWQAFCVLLPVKSVGVMGDERTYQYAVAVRMVQSTDGMTANWYHADHSLLSSISTRIINEVNGINRVVYDITTKPPGTIEWE